MTIGSTFSGIGAELVAASMLGWDVKFKCEINPFGRQLLDFYFPEAKSYEDITKTDFSEWRGKIDILTGGFPCQPFSYAGKRRGSEDDRYLWPFMLRCIEQIRPTWFVGENVAGIATMVFPGEDVKVGEEASLFGESDLYEKRQGYVIEEICGNLERIGYSVQPVLIPACAVGAPHRRDRVFFIAHLDAADPDRRDDGAGESREPESEMREEGIQKRDSVQQPEQSADVRPEMQRHDASDTADLRRGQERPENYGSHVCGEREGEGGLGSSDHSDGLGSDGNASDPSRHGHRASREGGCPEGDGSDRLLQQSQRGDEAERPDGLPQVQGDASDATGGRGREGRDNLQSRASDGNVPEQHGGERTPSDSRDSRREDAAPEPERGGESGKARDGSSRTDIKGFPWSGEDLRYLLPENRWRAFPSVSPVYRGNDGLPFPVDCLAIPFSRWKKEALKAYGNAIVVQVMYEIFRAIDIIENGGER